MKKITEKQATDFLIKASPSLHDKLQKHRLRSSVCGMMVSFADEIQSESTKSDAVEFAEWLDETRDLCHYGHREGFWKLTKSTLSPSDYTIQQLYEFFQSTTKTKAT